MPKVLDINGKTADQIAISGFSLGARYSENEEIGSFKNIEDYVATKSGKPWGPTNLEVVLTAVESRELSNVRSNPAMQDGYVTTMVLGEHDVTQKGRDTRVQNILLRPHTNMIRSAPTFDACEKKVRTDNPDASDAEVYSLAAEMLASRREWTNGQNDISRTAAAGFAQAVADYLATKSPGDVITFGVMKRYLLRCEGVDVLAATIFEIPELGISHSDFRPKADAEEASVETEMQNDQEYSVV